ncbi:hypothetical protein GLOIN_2v1874483 [Rhizophagus irregularis DAOM 181602=DAOM 197198]|nr:hypothetical protein GLOIN_2v1874483 [Rhizophagus irregularis DAOM 181602=DAOM 197198]
MPGAMVKIILDKIYNKTVPKPINLRPGYDMEHVFNGPQTDEYRYEKVVEIEKQYDYLSIIRPHETPQQWADRIRGSLQELLSKREYSVYHVYCLFASFGQLKSKTFNVNGELFEDHFRYRKPSVHKSQMAICFKCWKLVKITEVEPRKVYYSGWGRWAYEVESEDLMKNHWNYSCFKAKTATIAKNTMSSAPNFEPTCISPTSYHSSGPSQRCSEPGVTSKVFMSSLRKVFPEIYGIHKLLGKYGISELSGIFFSRNFPRLYHLPIIEYMSSQPNFNEHYKNLLDQLPPSMKKDVWLRLTNCKNKPLSEEQVRGIHPDIEELLTREVNRYFNKKNRQKIKIEANTSSDGSSTLSRLDGFEKQLEEHELCVQQRENNIKKTIDAQVAEERKRLKDEYDALKYRLESEYNNCMVDMKQKTYSFKHQLESQHNSRSAELEKQYKSHISALDKANAVKDKEIGKLSSTISQLKNEKWDIKKTADSLSMIE